MAILSFQRSELGQEPLNAVYYRDTRAPSSARTATASAAAGPTGPGDVLPRRSHIARWHRRRSSLNPLLAFIGPRGRNSPRSATRRTTHCTVKCRKAATRSSRSARSRWCHARGEYSSSAIVARHDSILKNAQLVPTNGRADQLRLEAPSRLCAATRRPSEESCNRLAPAVEAWALS